MKMMSTVEQLHLFTSQNQELAIFHVSLTGTSAPGRCTLATIPKYSRLLKPQSAVRKKPRRTAGVFVGLVAIQLPGFTPAAASLCPQSSGGGDMIPPGFRTDWGVISPVDFPFCSRWRYQINKKQPNRCALENNTDFDSKMENQLQRPESGPQASCDCTRTWIPEYIANQTLMELTFMPFYSGGEGGVCPKRIFIAHELDNVVWASSQTFSPLPSQNLICLKLPEKLHSITAQISLLNPKYRNSRKSLKWVISINYKYEFKNTTVLKGQFRSVLKE